MTVTLIGIAFTKDGHAQRLEIADDRWTISTRSWAQPASELRRSQPNHIPLNIAHDKSNPVGQVLALRRNRDGAVWALATCDNDRLADYEGAIYYSPETTRRPDGTDILLEGMAVTDAPATIALRWRPLEVFPGGLDAAGGWLRERRRLDGIRRDIVDQAVEQSRFQNRDQPLLVRDPAAEAAVEEFHRERAQFRYQAGRVDDRLIAPQHRAGWKRGDLEWGQPTRILSVK